MSTLDDWLRTHGLGSYRGVFLDNDIDFRALRRLTEADLKELGVSLGHRRVLQAAVEQLDESDLAQPVAAGDGRAPPAGRDDEAERRQLTVMFADLAGSTALAERLDLEELRVLNRAYQDAAKHVIESHGGYVARYMGDGVLAYFGYPRAHEDDALRAVRAGLGLANSVSELDATLGRERGVRLAVRVGIATGPVVVGDLIGEGASQETTAVGETPNLAARLQGLADLDSVVIAPDTLKLTGGHFRYRDLGEKPLKGFARPVRAWCVLGESNAESRFAAAHGGQLTPLTGRAEELALLVRCWEQARDGEGQVVTISGEAGIGKSRLTETLRRQLAGESHDGLHFQCSPHHRDSSLYPVIAHLSQVMGLSTDEDPAARLDKLEQQLGATAEVSEEDLALFSAILSIPVAGRFPPLDLDAQQRNKRTLAALSRHVEALARHRPVLCVCEDAHWIDPTTSAFLSLLTARVAQLPLLLLVTHRPEFEAPWAEQAGSTALALGRIGRQQSRAMVEAMLGETRLSEEMRVEIVARADGVPLFLEELTRNALDIDEANRASSPTRSASRMDIPSTLRDSLVARLDRLTLGKQVAQVAAVIGRDFPYELLARACDLESEHLDEGLQQLIRHGLVHAGVGEGGAVFSFKHALMQDAAYESLLHSKRRLWHARVAEVLEDRYPAVVQSRPELLAHHFTEAGFSERAVQTWQRSGERATEQGASAEGLNNFSKALALLEATPDTVDRARREIAIQIGVATNLRVLDRNEEALEILSRAQATAESHDFALELARVHHLLGNLCFPRGDIEGCLQQHESSLEYARKARSVACEAQALGGLGDAEYMRGRMISANRAFTGCVELCRIHGFAGTEVANFAMVAHTRFYLNELQGALSDASAAIEAASRAGHERAALIAHNAAVIALLSIGDTERAQPRMERREELIRHLGARLFEPESLRFNARVLAARGERQVAVDLLQRAVRLSRETSVGFLGPWILADLAVTTDDAGVRRDALDEAEVILRAGAVSHCHLWFYPGAIDAAATAQDWGDVERYASALEAYTRFEPLPWSDFHVARGRVLAACGRGQRDVETFGEVRRLREQARRMGLQSALAALDRALARSSPLGQDGRGG